MGKRGDYARALFPVGATVMGLAGCVSCLNNLPRPGSFPVAPFNLITGAMIGAVIGGVFGAIAGSYEDAKLRDKDHGVTSPLGCWCGFTGRAAILRSLPDPHPSLRMTVGWNCGFENTPPRRTWTRIMGSHLHSGRRGWGHISGWLDGAAERRCDPVNPLRCPRRFDDESCRRNSGMPDGSRASGGFSLRYRRSSAVPFRRSSAWKERPERRR
jgi:hypothetical protein